MAAESVRFDQDLIRRYDGRGPRYTSYPTALQFGDAVGADEYLQNARASNDSGNPLSLYVHIPFCHSLCYYCGCNKIVTRNEARVRKYLDNLCREIELHAELFDASRVTEQLHFGGGTPTYLNDDQLRGLLDKLGEAFTLEANDNRQFSIEVDPRTVDGDRIQLLGELGFNRLSLGIQDFAPDVQQAVNRVQSAAEVKVLVDVSREAGFGSVSFDLIYGLPHQTVSSFSTTLDLVIAMRPDRLAVYNYAHLPQRFKGQRMIDADELPPPEVKLDILGHTIDRLTDSGYIYIGMDHFALPSDELVSARREGTLQRNFQGYSTHRHCDLVGLGVSSIGSIGRLFAQNAVTTMEYEALLDNDTIPVRRGIAVDDDDKLRADVIQSLMCYDRLDFTAFAQTHDVDVCEYFEAEIARLVPLADDGLIELDDDGIVVTPRGRLLLRNVAMVFDRYINAADSDMRFSKAI